MARLSGFHLEGGIGKTMLDLVYPVNSLYLTAGSENPATVLGGTWAKLTGGVLAAAGTSGYAAAGATGGSKKIGVSQMPRHTHTMMKTNWQDWASNDQGIKNRMCVATGATAGARILLERGCTASSTPTASGPAPHGPDTRRQPTSSLPATTSRRSRTVGRTRTSSPSRRFRATATPATAATTGTSSCRRAATRGGTPLFLATTGLTAVPSTRAEASPTTTCRTPYASRCGGAPRDLCGAMPL